MRVDKWLFAVLSKYKMFVSWVSERNYYSWGKNLSSLYVYFRTCGIGNKARLPFPGGTEAGFRGDFYLLPILDKEGIGERAEQITI